MYTVRFFKKLYMDRYLRNEKFVKLVELNIKKRNFKCHNDDYEENTKIHQSYIKNDYLSIKIQE